MNKLLVFALARIAFPTAAHAAPVKPSTPAAKPAPKPAPKPDAITSAPTKIVYDGPDDEAIKDLRAALEGFDAGEIVLEKTELGAHTGQEFYLVRKNQKTYIKYTADNSLQNAVYTLLDSWGFHWYGPGENWFIKPKAIPASDIAGKWIAPTFRNRSFAGTGGLDFPAPNPRAFDPTNKYQSDWYAWKRRNRFSVDFRDAGHGGQAFYAENKELLNKHPEWFNGDLGKQSGRIKIEVPEAVAAYKAWIKKKHAAATEAFINIGVEPEDGRGGVDDPLPPDGFGGIDKWNHADKWWWLANEVAKEYSEENGHIVVSMYAYGDGPTNVLPPKFELRKNVYPIIIPYAFQTAYLPQQMVKVWGSKVSGKMGIYDYWNITQWSQGLPQFYLYGLKSRLQFWRDNKIDGAYIETTDAAGPMGHAWWIGGQLEFDLNKDFNALYNQYLNDCFGAAAPAMKKMYDRWSNNGQAAAEVSLSLADLQAADALVEKNSPQWKRINELKAYAHFMKLYYAHDGTQASKDKLFEYLYSIHHLFMVQTAAFMGQWYISPTDKGNIIPVGTDKKLSPEEIDAQFREDLKSDPVKYRVSNFQFDYAKAKFTEPMNSQSWKAGRSTTIYFVPQKAGEVSFEAGALTSGGFKGSSVALSIFTDEDVVLNDTVGTANFDTIETLGDLTYHMKKFTLKVEAGKKYFVRFRGFNRFKMNSDLIVYNAHNNDDFDNGFYPLHYLFIPKDCDEIIVEDTDAGNHGSTTTGAFFTPGEKWNEHSKDAYGAPAGIKNLYRVAVKPEWKGHVIAFGFGHPGWSLKNLPNVYALQPFDYQE